MTEDKSMSENHDHETGEETKSTVPTEKPGENSKKCFCKAREAGINPKEKVSNRAEEPEVKINPDENAVTEVNEMVVNVNTAESSFTKAEEPEVKVNQEDKNFTDAGQPEVKPCERRFTGVEEARRENIRRSESQQALVEEELEFEHPEGGWGWVVMVASMWCNGSVFGIQNTFGILFVSLLKEFGSEDDEDLRFRTEEPKIYPQDKVTTRTPEEPEVKITPEKKHLSELYELVVKVNTAAKRLTKSKEPEVKVNQEKKSVMQGGDPEVKPCETHFTEIEEMKKENRGDMEVQQEPVEEQCEFEHPEGGWGWVVMLASMWCIGSVFGIQNIFGIFFVSLLKEFGSETDDDLRFRTENKPMGGNLQPETHQDFEPIVPEEPEVNPEKCFAGAEEPKIYPQDKVTTRAPEEPEVKITPEKKHLSELYELVVKVNTAAKRLTKSKEPEVKVNQEKKSVMQGGDPEVKPCETHFTEIEEMKKENRGDMEVQQEPVEEQCEFEHPEGGWGWVVMLASMWCIGSVFGIQNIFGIFFVSLLKEFGSETDDDLRFRTGIIPLTSNFHHFHLKNVPVLLDRFGLRITLRVLSILMFVLVLAELAYKPRLPQREESRNALLKRICDVHIWRSLSYRIWAFGIPAALFGYFVPYAISVMVIGVMTMLIPVCNVFGGLIAVCFLMGLSDGCFFCTMAPIAFELVGSENVSQALGFVLGMMSLPMLVGPRIA
ncbi:monocarboxylate transporter 10, partial [Clarias magur]